MSNVPSSARRPDVDPAALARVVRGLSRAVSPPWLHGEVARRMGERLSLVLRQPATVLQWWGALGAGDDVLAAAYPQARRWSVEPDADTARRRAAGLQAPWWSSRRWTTPACEAVAEADLAARRADLVWANMALHWAADPAALMARWKACLNDDGFLMFSTVGPDTLAELREVHAVLGAPPPAAAFVDMHDLGDMLVEAGFADPVMDQETITLTWPAAEPLLAELRALGGNVHAARFAALRTPRWRQRLAEVLEARRDGAGRIALRFEVVYGHAFNAPPKARVTPRTEVSLESFRAMARRRPGDRSGPV